MRRARAAARIARAVSDGWKQRGRCATRSEKCGRNDSGSTKRSAMHVIDPRRARRARIRQPVHLHRRRPHRQHFGRCRRRPSRAGRTARRCRQRGCVAATCACGRSGDVVQRWPPPAGAGGSAAVVGGSVRTDALRCRLRRAAPRTARRSAARSDARRSRWRGSRCGAAGETCIAAGGSGRTGTRFAHALKRAHRSCSAASRLR